MRVFSIAAPNLLCLLVARPVLAADFAKDGTYRADPNSVVTLDFEDLSADYGGAKAKADPGALSGAASLPLAAQKGVDIPVSLPKRRATYRVTAWAKDRETVADLQLGYTSDNPDRTDEIAALYPTGRVTSDGWVELANSHIRVDGARLTHATLGFFSAQGAVVDAAEIIADGDSSDLPTIANAACGGAMDGSSCGDQQICVWSTCRNVNGWVPPIPAERDAVASYLGNRLQLLFGPYRERQLDLPAALVAIDRMKLAKTPWDYWNGFSLAVRRLHDGHTSTSGLADFVVRNPRPLALCFLEGDADLSHQVAPKDADYLDVLVSLAGGDHNLGLKPGDRLVRVDGMHPIAWARSLIEFNWSQPSISNHVSYAELASSLRGMISRYANHIEVVRCDVGGLSCGAVETIDVSAIPFDAPGTPFDGVQCDNRPKRHVPGAPANHATGETVYQGLITDADPAEKLYGMEWESLFTTNGQDGVGADLSAAVTQWRADAHGVILDHRTGFGGTILAPQILWNFSVPAKSGDAYFDRFNAEDEMPSVADGQALWQSALATGQVETIGSNNPVTDVPVALLITEDVSASDWLPYGLKGAPKTRLFGPFQTNGGFSTRYSFGYWLSVGYVAAVGDTLDAQGITFNGHGIEPDQVVLPKQSDLLVGKDTVFEAALAWVRAEAKP
jgi:hypothetical protein